MTIEEKMQRILGGRKISLMRIGELYKKNKQRIYMHRCIRVLELELG